MINPSTIALVRETVRIEEVVGDFVTLKRRGVNLIGNCPFHNEKTPSFTVSPVKGIFKCFGCGKAGDSITFVMEHEHYTYQEAIRFLAKRYNIEIEEQAPDPAFKEQQNQLESLYLVSAFAQKKFSDDLFNHEEGRALGFSYFKERGFNEAIIQKFQLGYSINEWDAFSKEALKAGYQAEFLEKTGLSISGERGLFDRFKGRVMFPIHSLSGRVIGFGGRILKQDGKQAKYLNSPESEIYHKSKVLYGIYFAKKAILAADTCYLVEGYTDVISMHMAGVENVVASSGTSLTEDQIHLISRFTKNVTVLYDGDEAGIKASLRGINMILQQGLNVKIVLFPDGDDPDSYSRKVSSDAFQQFISDNAKDFVLFKTKLLLEESEKDPTKRAGLVRDILETISVIPDGITRTSYIKECNELLKANEQGLHIEVNKIRSFVTRKVDAKEDENAYIPETPKTSIQELFLDYSCDYQERDIIRLLINYGQKELLFLEENSNKEVIERGVTVAAYIIQEYEQDHTFLAFENNHYDKILQYFIAELKQNSIPDLAAFTHDADKEIAELAINLSTTRYGLSPNWEKKHHINIANEEDLLKEAVTGALNSLKIKKLLHHIHQNQQKLKGAQSEEELLPLMQLQQQLDAVKQEISKTLGIVINK